MPSNPSLLNSPKQRHGGDYEKIAAHFLQQQGLYIIAQNWQQPNVGEIDLIMMHPAKAWDTLVFAEVRKRKVSNYGDALTSVTKAKQRKLIKTARFFLIQNPSYAQFDCRFDVIAFNEVGHFDSQNKPIKNRVNEADPKSGKQKVITAIDWIEPEWVQGAFITNAW